MESYALIMYLSFISIIKSHTLELRELIIFIYAHIYLSKETLISVCFFLFNFLQIKPFSQQDLQKKYSSIRKTRPDGNCFYRAFGFSHMESLLEDSKELHR